MYVCGVTPYDNSHIGHAMSYIVFDVIRRYLEFGGYKVRYVQNITDIDDKIINRAATEGVSAPALAERFTDSFFSDMDALNVMRNAADTYPRATGEIDKIIEVIAGLVAKDYAYPSQGSVYFRVRRVADYGKLSHRSLDSMKAGARIESGEEKEDPIDFVLWKAAKPGEPSWPSPWGKGRPGWHIECSAMSLKYLGETIDIHGGGQDLIFPHHENEIAQSESYTGVKPFVRYWLHNGLLKLGGEKMSKSLGNLITIKTALRKYSADAVRIFVLSSHYRSPLTYSEMALEAAERGTERLCGALRESDPNSELNRSILKKQGTRTDDILPVQTYRNRFIAAMDDDFNTAQALATLFGLAQEINRAVNLGYEDKIAEHGRLFKELAGVLGLTLEQAKKKPLDTKLLLEIASFVRDQILSRSLPQGVISGIRLTDEQWNEISGNAEELMEYLSSSRSEFRKNKEFELADQIRTKLAEIGIVLEDTPQGTVWKPKRGR